MENSGSPDMQGRKAPEALGGRRGGCGGTKRSIISQDSQQGASGHRHRHLPHLVDCCTGTLWERER
jgi:hypothetical protein